MIEKPHLVISQWIAGEQLAYKCSVCSQTFLLPEDRNPKQAMAEVWAAFNEHVREAHHYESA